MSRVFLADTADYVEVPDATVTLGDICAAFHHIRAIDPTSAYIRRANSGAVVATLPTDTLPEFSGSVEYILCAANVGVSAGDDGRGGHANRHGAGATDDASGNIEHAVLRMAQLVDTMTGAGAEAAAASEEDKQAVAAFFAQFSNESSNHQQQKSAAGADGSNQAFANVSSRHALFVSSTDGHYHPHSVALLAASMPRKNVCDLKYSFDLF